MIRQEAKRATLNATDLLYTLPSSLPFERRVTRLQLSPDLTNKTIARHRDSLADYARQHPDREILSHREEEELSQEMLHYRRRFTSCLLQRQRFRQAALTVIQNIYLFQDRHIFFHGKENPALERQQALELFSNPAHKPLPISKTLGHMILARIWRRITANIDDDFISDPGILELHSVVANMNCLRNIYILFSGQLIAKLAARTRPIYRQSITYEDAVQIGTFGVAKAAYRYHFSCGIPFSSYATNWVSREIQQQALHGRLIRISSNVIEQYARAGKQNDAAVLAHYGPSLADALPMASQQHDFFTEKESKKVPTPEYVVEKCQCQRLLNSIIDHKLPKRTADIVKQRYGLPPYENNAASAVNVANQYGLTRGRIYQIEKEAYSILKKAIEEKLYPEIKKQELFK